MQYAFTGIDPGLVHSALVRVSFDPEFQAVTVNFCVVDGLNPVYMRAAMKPLDLGLVFIEDYRVRGNLKQNAKMIEGVAEFRKVFRATGPTVLNNMGAKQVVRQPLMEAFGIWKFPHVTHHQDLRAAGRIGMFGALKDAFLNEQLARALSRHIRTRPNDVVYRDHS